MGDCVHALRPYNAVLNMMVDFAVDPTVKGAKLIENLHDCVTVSPVFVQGCEAVFDLSIEFPEDPIVEVAKLIGSSYCVTLLCMCRASEAVFSILLEFALDPTVKGAKPVKSESLLCYRAIYVDHLAWPLVDGALLVVVK
jgi:hypothetical protein